MKPRPPPQLVNYLIFLIDFYSQRNAFYLISRFSIVLADTLCIWETKLWLVKFFVALFEETSKSSTNQADRGVDTSDTPLGTVQHRVGAIPTRVSSSIHQKPKIKCTQFPQDILSCGTFLCILPIDKCGKVRYNNRLASTGPRRQSGPEFPVLTPHMQNFLYFQHLSYGATKSRNI